MNKSAGIVPAFFMAQDKKKEKKSLVETLAERRLSFGSPYYQTLIFLMRNPEAINILPLEDRVKATEIINRVQQSANIQTPSQVTGIRQQPISAFPQFRQFPQRTFPEVRPMVDFNYTLSQEEKKSLDRFGKSIDENIKKIESKYQDKIIPIEKIGEKEWQQYVSEVREGKTPSVPFKIPVSTQPISTPIPSPTPALQQTAAYFVEGTPEDFKPIIADVARKYNFDTALLSAQLKQESNFNPFARSVAGAAGIAQFIPETARKYGLRVDNQIDERFDPVKAIEAQGQMMRENINIYGSVERALSAYNSGNPDRYKDPSFTTRYGSVGETYNYVNRIMRDANKATKSEISSLDILPEQKSIWQNILNPQQVLAAESPTTQMMNFNILKIPTPSSVTSSIYSPSQRSLLVSSIYKPAPKPTVSIGGGGGGGGVKVSYSAPSTGGMRTVTTSTGRATTVAPAKTGGYYYSKPAPAPKSPANYGIFGGGSARGGKGASGGW